MFATIGFLSLAFLGGESLLVLLKNEDEHEAVPIELTESVPGCGCAKAEVLLLGSAELEERSEVGDSTDELGDMMRSAKRESENEG